MTDQIKDKKRKRFLFLNKLYEVTDGNENAMVNLWELGKELGFSKEESDRVDEYLLGEGLIEHVTLGGMISITHRGIVETETALSKPDEPTEHFLPFNYIHVDQMIGSQIQQGSNHSTQSGSYSSNDFEAIHKFVTDFKTVLADLKLDFETQKEANSDIETVESQIKSSHPKLGIIKECLYSLRTILEGAAGNMIATALLPQIIALLK